MKFKCLVVMLVLFFKLAVAWGEENLAATPISTLTADEMALIAHSKQHPVRIGVIPNIYPMSVTPPESPKFAGITISLLENISRKTGLEIELVRIDIERTTPIGFLKSGAVDAVAGTLKIKRFIEDPSLVLSDRLFDATVSFVSKKDRHFEKMQDKPVVIAIMAGFQAGQDYVAARFKNYKYKVFHSAEACFEAVRRDEADVAVINKYIASYHLQKPQFDEIDALQTFSINQESCISARKGAETLISIVNKGLKGIEGSEFSNILMNFTLASTYKMTGRDFLYKYAYTIGMISVFSLLFAYVLLKLLSAMGLKKKMYSDHLTGLLTPLGFDAKVKEILKKSGNKQFIIDFQIVKFHEYNLAYGTEQGDALLCHIADMARNNFARNACTARIYAGHFVTLDEAEDLSIIIDKVKSIGNTLSSPQPNITVMLIFGIYPVVDRSLPVKTMVEHAATAKLSVKGFSENYFAVYDEAMYFKSVEDANILAHMNMAIKHEEFYLVYQPKYDTYTEEIKGCEALIRWKRQDGTIVMPGQFIELFEKNGQIISLDFYALEKVCRFLRGLMDSGIDPVAVSVNFSRINLYDQSFVSRLISVVEKYHISPSLLEIELTESAMIDDKKYVLSIINRLHEHGFIIALDDFGTGYSSLNSLKDLPIDVLKLDKEFVVYDEEKGRGQQIIKTVLQLTDSLGMCCVAEGVETREQLDFLRHCTGCNLVQGFYFSKPLDEAVFVEKLHSRMKPGAVHEPPPVC